VIGIPLSDKTDETGTPVPTIREVWYGEHGTYYELEYIRSSEGEMLYWIMYGITEGRAGTPTSCIIQMVDALPAGFELHPNSDWHRVGDWKYEWRTVWIAGEGVGAYLLTYPAVS
jgi:hypothetical protein